MPPTTFEPERPSQTKIVATLGPASDSPEMLERLIRAGVDVFRLNMAHGSPEAQQERLDAIRDVSRRIERPVGVLADLAGPKIRLGELPDDKFQCDAGETVRFVRGDASTAPGRFTCTYEPLIDELEVGDRIMLADGAVSLRVEEKTADEAVCIVTQPGLVRSRQGVNLPGVKLSIPTLQDVDRVNAAWASKAGVDFLGLSFVRTANDVRELKHIVAENGGHAQVISKIEKPEALENLEEIIEATDGVMVARGDLGVETDIARIAVVQKRIIDLCRRAYKPVITATQMLDSMQHEALPTRAEATDVANAVLDGTDACMLSGETAIGKYPVESVAMMHRISLATEELRQGRLAPDDRALRIEERIDDITLAMADAAGELSETLDAKTILVATPNGDAALALSKQRRSVPTVGVSDSNATLQRIALYWGVVPVPGIPTDDPAKAYEAIVTLGKARGFIEGGDRIVVLDGVDPVVKHHSALRVRVVD